MEGPLIAADFNTDGRTDLGVIAAGAWTSADHRGSTLSVLLNQGPFPNRPPLAVARADSRTECASPSGAAVTLDGSASSDPDSTPGTQDDISAYEWYEGDALLGSGPVLTLTLPLGPHAITLRVTDRTGAAGTAEVAVAVVDTRPPDIQLLLSPTILWPPDHQIRDVHASASASDLCGPSSLVLVTVLSSEPDDGDGEGDGHTRDDIQGASLGTPDFDFRLRGERSTAGSGRRYTVNYRATDSSGNSSSATASVLVPLNRN
jgi:hypothetical protein